MLIIDLVFWGGVSLLCWTLLKPRITGVKVRDYSMLELLTRSQQITWSFWFMGAGVLGWMLFGFAAF